MIRHLGLAAVAVVFACASGMVVPASGQSDSTASVEAKGIPAGGFRFYPSVEASLSYDDNVYRTDAGTRSDVFFTETPKLSLQSNWLRHELDLYASLSATQYSKLNSEDHNDWTFGGNGRLDVVRGVDFSAGGSYAIAHELRTSPDQSGFAKNPTEYSVAQAQAALGYHPYHFSLTIGGNYVRYEYDPTKLIGFPDLNNHDRDRDDYTGYVKGGFEFSPGYAAFVQVNYRDTKYDLAIDRTGVNRSNHGYSVNAGVDMLVTELIKGQVFVGYLDQTYSGSLEDIKGFNYGARIDWNPSALWVFHFVASRTPNATTIAHASASDDQVVRVGVDYLITRTITILAHAGYTDSEFRGSPRHDKYADVGIGATYAVNQYAGLKLDYSYQERNSSLGGQNYTDNLVVVGLNLHI